MTPEMSRLGGMVSAEDSRHHMLRTNHRTSSAMTYARDEAIRIVQWVLSSIEPNESIAVELPFLSVRRKADIAVLSPSRLSAIEIKGARDNTQSLGAQLSDYQSMFLDVTVAVAPRHLDRVRDIASREVGILLLDEEAPRLLRKPKRRIRLSPTAAANWLSRRDLAILLGTKSVETLGITDARDAAIRSVPAGKLSQFALTTVANRNAERFNAFCRERGTSPIDLDDLSMLALQQNVRR